MGCSSGELDGLDGPLADAENTSHSERIIVGFSVQTPERMTLDGDQLRVRELHSQLRLATLPIPAGMDAAEMVSHLERRSDIRFAELDHTRSISGTVVDDSYFSYQWNLQQIGAEAVWEKSYDGASTIVAVIDTGVSDGGPDGLSLSQGENAGWDFVSGDDDPSDANGHGTHVAGTIAQNTGNGIGVAGIAHGSEIMAVRVLDANGYGYVSDITAGILWAADHGADVINLSLGSSMGSQAEEEAVAYAVDMGVLVVASTGNEYLEDGVSYPAAYSDVLAVGASNAIDEIVSYTNQGPELDLLAPGGDFDRDDDGNGVGDGIVQETVIDGEWGYYLFEGTSMASPHVAGSAAVLMGMGASAEEAREILELSAADTESGWGRLDLEAAVAELESRLDDDDELTDPTTDTEDLIAPEFTLIRAAQNQGMVHVQIHTNEIARVLVCIPDTEYCAVSSFAEEHMFHLRADEARLTLIARDPSGNTRVIPLHL